MSCCFAAQQLVQIVPNPAALNAPVEVFVQRDKAPVAGATVTLRRPNGATRVLGVTGASGGLTFTAADVGTNVIEASIDGVVAEAPLLVIAPSNAWPMALGSVPLGLAALWALSRALGRRAP